MMNCLFSIALCLLPMSSNAAIKTMSCKNGTSIKLIALMKTRHFDNEDMDQSSKGAIIEIDCANINGDSYYERISFHACFPR